MVNKDFLVWNIDKWITGDSEFLKHGLTPTEANNDCSIRVINVANHHLFNWIMYICTFLGHLLAYTETLLIWSCSVYKHYSLCISLTGQLYAIFHILNVILELDYCTRQADD